MDTQTLPSPAAAERFTSFHTGADLVDVDPDHELDATPVLLLDSQAPATSVAILLTARARRLYRTINMLLPVGLSRINATELVDLLHPLADEVAQLAEVLQGRLQASARETGATADAEVRHG
jgi:hypothetical protein